MTVTRDQRLRKLERYKIAQLFHELARDLHERMAASCVAHFHGLSTDQVLAVAKEFKPESHWRL